MIYVLNSLLTEIKVPGLLFMRLIDFSPGSFFLSWHLFLDFILIIVDTSILIDINSFFSVMTYIGQLSTRFTFDTAGIMLLAWILLNLRSCM